MEQSRGRRWSSQSPPDHRGIFALGGIDHALARIAGRFAQTLFGPIVEVADRINDAPAEFVKDRAGAVAAMLLEGARRQSEMHGSIGGADKAGRDRGNGCIHGQAPGGLGSTGAVPPTEAGNGASGTRAGSDRLGGSLIVTTPSARSGSVVRRSRAAARNRRRSFARARKSVGEGKSVSVSVVLGGRRSIKKRRRTNR